MATWIKLQDWWARTGAGVDTEPGSEKAILALERRYDLTIPEDFRAYLHHSSPKTDNWDEEMGNWWPVSRILNVPDEYPHEIGPAFPDKGRKLLFFLDHSIWCWAWAISCANDETRGKIANIGTRDAFVADSFSEFVDRYTSDWMSLS